MIGRKEKSRVQGKIMAKTAKELKEARKAEQAARINDRLAEKEVCRKIRDDEKASPAEKLKAIELLLQITE